MEGTEKIMSVSQWYLIHSKARQEDVAEVNLRLLGVEIFCPRLRKLKPTRSKAQSEGEVLFPGYFFVKIDMKTGYRKVTYAHGVLRVVKFGAEPAVVEEAIIDSIRQRVHNGFVILPPSTSFESGQIVRIHKGPFHGFEAIFEQELNGTQRVALLMKTVAFQGRLVLDRDCVEL
ncbi:transcription termination/antitermination NusG family protein [uncultured Nitrospira sp.]|uniref:transcription termination/antitermination NusG family protein n=1 Tax=uncultured Nitrospira sp. TaxID=157176 RepID=UPI00313FFE54